MRLLFAIPHYVRPSGEGRYEERQHGALDSGPESRVTSLVACLTALHQLFQPASCLIDHGRRTAWVVPAAVPHQLDVVICTTGGRHVLDRLPIEPRYFTHRETPAAPELLGFTCHDLLAERLGQYDYYGYLEDDLVLHDPWFFRKLAWFNAAVGDDKLLQPNRFEAALGYLVPKAYVDGDLGEHCTAPFQDVRDSPPQTLEAFGQRVVFGRTRNPHSGCFFVNARQMAHWVRQPHWTDRASRFIGPLETAASLGIMRAFRVYKPAPPQADFLEVEHHATGYLAQLRRPDGPGAPPNFSIVTGT